VLAIVSTLTDHCSTSIKRYAHSSEPQYNTYSNVCRAVQSHNVLTAEHYANPALPMSVVTVAARRLIRKELVHKIVILRVSFICIF
jgi:hypothetical protein